MKFIGALRAEFNNLNLWYFLLLTLLYVINNMIEKSKSKIVRKNQIILSE